MSLESSLPQPAPRMEITGDIRAILRAADLAADMEILCAPTPVSSVRNPDGSAQPETPAERTRRIIETAIMYCLENGLLTVADDAAKKLDSYMIMQRAPAA